MKQLNNKGFAISTVIYGLSIMGILLISILMGTISTTRTNSNQMGKTIEEELNRFSKTATAFSSKVEDGDNNPTSQEYIVPKGQSGWYRIELWGAQGGNKGGAGAYTSGVIELEEGDVLYFYVGKYLNSETERGRESDVRIQSGGYNDKMSYETRIMVAAGGGTATGASGGTLEGYTNKTNSIGGFIDIKEPNPTYALSSAANNPTNGTLVGYPKDFAKGNVPKTNAAPVGTNGGGDGYFASNASSTGGTSFIAGYGGVNAMVKGTLTGNTLYTYFQQHYDEDTESYIYDNTGGRSYYFVDGMMFAGTNYGDGRAKIEKVVSKMEPTQKLARANTKLDKVTQIRNCIGNTNASSKMAAFNSGTIEVIQNGVNIAKGKTYSGPMAVGDSGFENLYCRTLNLGTAVDVDEIAIFNGPNIDFDNHVVATNSNGEWKFIKNKGKTSPLSETETIAGVRFSAYQYDSTQELPLTGNYFLLPVVSETRVLTAVEDVENDSNAIEITPINGSQGQKWTVEYIQNTNVGNNYDDPALKNEYKIVELKRFKALAIQLDENILKNQISASSPFNNYARNEPQIWKIAPEGNGTYIISTVVPMFDDAKNSGNIMGQTNAIDANEQKVNSVIIAKKNPTAQRFRLISVDYSSTSQ